MQSANKKLKNQMVTQKTAGVNETMEKKELEQLFIDCVEDMRRNIIRRRLRAEIDARKKVGGKNATKQNQTIQQSASTLNTSNFENKQVAEFEESLEKLAEMAKGRVKLNEFTTKDRENLLDLFVNNEKTLLSIYEVLFPKPSLKYTQLKGATDNINIAGP